MKRALLAILIPAFGAAVAGCTSKDAGLPLDSSDDTEPDSGDSRDDTQGDTDTAVGPYWVDVSVGSAACGLSSTGRIQCWGGQAQAGAENAPDGTWVEMSAGWLYGCALDAKGVAACWGLDDPAYRDYDYGQANPPLGTRLRGLDAGDIQACALDEGGEVACWGYPPWDGWDPPDGAMVKVESGGSTVCSLDDSGGLSCWGSMVPEDTSGAWADFTVGTAVVGLDPAGYPSCWGEDEPNECHEVPADLSLKRVSAGTRCTCAITIDDELACWAADDRYAAPVRDMPVGGSWADVAVGWDGACALSTDGEIVCWGNAGFNNVPDPT